MAHKALVIQPFGHAKRGDSLFHASRSHGVARGFLKGARIYTEFMIPEECLREWAGMSEEELEYHARKTDPETAQREMKRKGTLATEREQKILLAARQRGRDGMTSKEASSLTGIPHVSTSTTMSKMVARNLLANTVERRDNAMVRVIKHLDPHARSEGLQAQA